MRYVLPALQRCNERDAGYRPKLCFLSVFSLQLKSPIQPTEVEKGEEGDWDGL